MKVDIGVWRLRVVERGKIVGGEERVDRGEDMGRGRRSSMAAVISVHVLIGLEARRNRLCHSTPKSMPEAQGIHQVVKRVLRLLNLYL